VKNIVLCTGGREAACAVIALFLTLCPAYSQETNAPSPTAVAPVVDTSATNPPSTNAATADASSTNAPSASASTTQVETLICIRHGEKTPKEEGQLNAQGLNRALALPQLLTSKYGRPQFIFAPDPSQTIGTKEHPVCYVRPLATIEPTAIFLGMPVCTPFGFRNAPALESELDKPDYVNALVFIAWEHVVLEKFVRSEVVHHGGGDGTQVPVWAGGDYDSIYIVRLTGAPGAKTATFTLEHEGLDHLSKNFPSPSSP
jgi:hypothetical protein